MHRRKQELGTDELDPSGARRAGRGFRNTLTVDESIGRCLGSNAVPVAFANMLLGLERYTLKEGSAPRNLTKGFTDSFGSTGTRLSSAPGIMSSRRPGPNLTKLDQLAEARQ
jgi:hypothetical protein